VRLLRCLAAIACASCSTVSTGTCFFVSPSGLALTSLHVVKNAHHINVFDSTGGRLRAEILERDVRLDLALMQTHGPSVPEVLPIAVNDAVPGDHVFAIRARTSGPQLVEGSIVEQHALGMEFLLGTSAQVERGSSGGPLVNEHGEVVGVMTKRREAPSGQATRLSFAVTMSSARAVFGTLPAGSHPAPLDRRGAIERARRASCLIIVK
jgi:serine protease Do